MANKLTLRELCDKIVGASRMWFDKETHLLMWYFNGEEKIFPVNNKPNNTARPMSARDEENEPRLIAYPDNSIIKDPKKSNRYMFFQPFSENIAAAGEPYILSSIKLQCLKQWDIITRDLIISILGISLGEVNPSELTEQQREVIENIGKVDEKFFNAFLNILKNLSRKTTKNKLLNLSLFKNFKRNERKYKRGAIWSFPLIEELNRVKEECTRDKSIKARIFEVEVRKSDLNILTNLCNVIFGSEEERAEAYGASDSNDAPYTEAYVRALYYLKRINRLTEIFFKGKYHVFSKEVADNFVKEHYVDLNWLKDDFKISDWKKEYLLLPSYEENEGDEPISQNVVIERKEKSDMHKWENIVEDEVPWKEDQATNTVQRQYNQSVNNHPQQIQQGYQKPNEPMSSDDSFLDKLSNQANINRAIRNGMYPQQMMNNVPMQAPVQNFQPQLQVDNMGREYFIDQFGRMNFTGKQIQQQVMRPQVQPQMQAQFDNSNREFIVDQFGNTQYTGRHKQVDQYGREVIIDQYNNVQYTGRQFPVQRPLGSAAMMTMSQPAYAMPNMNQGTFFNSNQVNNAPMGYNRNPYGNSYNNGYQSMPQAISGLNSLTSNPQTNNGYNNNQLSLSGNPV